VFAGQEQRLVRVVAGSPNSWTTERVLENMHGNFDAIAIAPYLTLYADQRPGFDASTTPDQVLDSVESVSLPRALINVDNHRALADEYAALLGRDIHLLAYEGGLDLLPLPNAPYNQALYDAGLSPRVHDILTEYLQGLDAHGLEMMVHFEYTGRLGFQGYLTGGDAGALHAQDEPLESAHRYRALVDFLHASDEVPPPVDEVPPPPSPPLPPPAQIIVTGTDAGQPAEIKVFDANTGALKFHFFAFDPSFLGGVRVAAGDVNGDGLADIIAGAGIGAGPRIRVFDGRTGILIRDFFAFEGPSAGGVYVAAGDTNGDGYADILVGADAGAAPHLRVFNGRDGAMLFNFYAYDTAFRGGVRVAVGDVNGDGYADLITGSGPGSAAHVKVFSGRGGTLLQSYYAYHALIQEGIFVAAGDVNGDGCADVITGTDAGGPAHVKVFSGRGGVPLASFFAYPAAFAGGVRVGATDLNGDGRADIVTETGPSGAPWLRGFDALTQAELDSFFAFDPAYRGGVHVGGR
jgi:hypothetical protein